MPVKTLRPFDSDAILNLRLNQKKNTKISKAALLGERMLTTSEAEDILNKILSDYLFEVNLN